MEKLGQLRRSDTWDLIIVDTPPSRSALDFLDAPERLGRFLDGRLIRILTGPARVGGRSAFKLINAGFGIVAGVLTKVLGGQLLKDIQTFVGALDAVFGGFRQRAEQTYRLLQAPGTAFIVVAAPERDAMREASYFVERLAEEGMPLAGLVVNRVHTVPAAALSAARSTAAAEELEARGEHELTAAVLRLHASRMQLAAREHREQEHFISAHPTVPLTQVPAMPTDVHNLPSLRQVATLLAT